MILIHCDVCEVELGDPVDGVQQTPDDTYSVELLRPDGSNADLCPGCFINILQTLIDKAKEAL